MPRFGDARVGVDRDGSPIVPFSTPEARLKVFVGLNHDPAAEAVIEFVKDLRRTFATDVTFHQMYWPLSTYNRQGLNGPKDVSVLERVLRERVGPMNDEGDPTGDQKGSVEYSVEAAWGQPGQSLAAAAEKHKADVLVVGSQQPHGWTRLLEARTPSAPSAAPTCPCFACLHPAISTRRPGRRQPSPRTRAHLEKRQETGQEAG